VTWSIVPVVATPSRFATTTRRRGAFGLRRQLGAIFAASKDIRESSDSPSSTDCRILRSSSIEEALKGALDCIQGLAISGTFAVAAFIASLGALWWETGSFALQKTGTTDPAEEQSNEHQGQSIK
jgi:hypothetical protein